MTLLIGIGAQAVATAFFLIYWATPPVTGHERGDSKDLGSFASFAARSVRWDEEVAVFTNGAMTFEESSSLAFCRLIPNTVREWRTGLYRSAKRIFAEASRL